MISPPLALSDRAAGTTITFKFNTDSLGVLDTLAGSPVVSVYKSGNTTPVTTGVTVTADYGAVPVVGLNNVVIDTSTDGVFYSNGSEYDVLITTGNIQGAPVAGRLLAHFKLRA